MRSAILLFMACQLSGLVLGEAKKALTGKLENNGKNMSPKEKAKYEQKIRISKFFGNFLTFGSAVYLILSFVLEVIVKI